MRRATAVLIGIVVAASAASPARAQDDVVAPPGNSGVDEYLEVVPGAGGDKPAAGRGSEAGSAPVTPSALPGAKAAAELRRLGADGQAAAELAAAGAPPDRKTAKRRAADSRLGDEARAGRSIVADDPGSRVGTIATALTGEGGGMGLVFPLLLVGTLVAAVVLLGARHLSRRR